MTVGNGCPGPQVSVSVPITPNLAPIDVEIMRCVEIGEPSDQIVLHYSGFVRALARKHSAPQDHIDHFQEVFERLSQRWESISSILRDSIAAPSRVLGKLLKIISPQVGVDFRRRRRVEGGEVLDFEQVSDAEVSHDPRYFEQADKWILAPSFERLEDKSRRIIKLRLEEGRPYREIRKLLKLPSETAARKLHHDSRKKFYRKVTDRCDEVLSYFGDEAEYADTVKIIEDIKRRAQGALKRKKTK